MCDSFEAKPTRLNCAFCATSTIFKGIVHFNMTMNIICVMLSLNLQLTFSSQTVSILNTSCLCYNVYIIQRTWAEIRDLFRVLNMISHEWAQRTSLALYPFKFVYLYDALPGF